MNGAGKWDGLGKSELIRFCLCWNGFGKAGFKCNDQTRGRHNRHADQAHAVGDGAENDPAQQASPEQLQAGAWR